MMKRKKKQQKTCKHFSIKLIFTHAGLHKKYRNHHIDELVVNDFLNVLFYKTCNNDFPLQNNENFN
jgi:hypothetical protein